MWSAFEIGIILHHHTSTATCRNETAPIYAQTVDRLIDAGVLELRPECRLSCPADETPYRTSAAGIALVRAWKLQPVPDVADATIEDTWAAVREAARTA